MASQTQTQWKRFLDELYSGGTTKRRRLPPEDTFISTALACGFPAALEDFRHEGRTDCRALLRLCGPLLDRICAEPDEGWLPFFYDSIAAGLFADPSVPQILRSRSRRGIFI